MNSIEKETIYNDVLGTTCHELKQPILNALARLIVLEEDSPAIEIAENALIECAQKIDITLTALKTLYTDNKKSLVTLNANECIVNALSDCAMSAAERNKIIFESPNNFFFEGDVIMFNHIIFNLLNNAFRHIKNKRGSNILISVKNRTISVSNDIYSAIDTSAIFKKYTSSNKSQSSKNGTGLGLSYCMKAMKIFNGKINAESNSTHIVFNLEF